MRWIELFSTFYRWRNFRHHASQVPTDDNLQNQDRSPSLAEAEELNQYKMFRSSSKKYFLLKMKFPNGQKEFLSFFISWGVFIFSASKQVSFFCFWYEYIMRNAGLDEAQAVIKIAGRNIKNLRYANDTTLMAESEEELKSQEPFDESERGEWKSRFKTQHSEN